MEPKDSPDSKLQIKSLCSVRILSILEVIAKIAKCSTLTQAPFQFGTLHPKFQPFAKEEYQKGVFTGARDEIEHLTLDIINTKNVPYRQMAAHFKTEASSALREGDVVGWVEKSLFKGILLYQVFVVKNFSFLWKGSNSKFISV